MRTTPFKVSDYLKTPEAIEAYAAEKNAEIARLRTALRAAQTYVDRAAGSFGSDWRAMEVANQVREALAD